MSTYFLHAAPVPITPLCGAENIGELGHKCIRLQTEQKQLRLAFHPSVEFWWLIISAVL